MLLTLTASKPAMAALAGLVPWALSGMRTRERFSPLIPEVRRGDEQGRQFALSAGGRLQRHAIETGDLGEDVLHLPQQLRACPGRNRRFAADADRPCPAGAASRSCRLGLYFMVHDPSG